MYNYYLQNYRGPWTETISSAICRGRRLERHIRGVDSEASGHKGSSQGVVRHRRLESRDSGEPVAAFGRDLVHGNQPRETSHPFGERTRAPAERAEGSFHQVHRAPWTTSQIPLGQRRRCWILSNNYPRRRSPPSSHRPRRPASRTATSRIDHSGQR